MTAGAGVEGGALKLVATVPVLTVAARADGAARMMVNRKVARAARGHRGVVFMVGRGLRLLVGRRRE